MSLWKWHAFVNLRPGINFLVIHILSLKGYNESTLVISMDCFNLCTPNTNGAGIWRQLNQDTLSLEKVNQWYATLHTIIK